jgi:DNA-binding CsgD family transcriptional regulator
VRALLGEDLRLSHEAARAAETAFKIRVYIAVEQGLTTSELSEDLGISQSSVSKYRMQGEAAYRERLAASE